MRNTLFTRSAQAVDEFRTSPAFVHRVSPTASAAAARVGITRRLVRCLATGYAPLAHNLSRHFSSVIAALSPLSTPLIISTTKY